MTSSNLLDYNRFKSTRTQQTKPTETMSNKFSEEYYERLKDEFAEDNLDLEYDSDEFIEKFKEHLQDLEHFNNHPSLSAYERNRSLAN